MRHRPRGGARDARTWRVVLAAAALVSSWVAFQRDSSASTPGGRCMSAPWFAPGDGRSIPANAPALVFVAARDREGRLLEPRAFELSVRHEDGQPLSLSWSEPREDAHFLTTSEPLRPGRYLVRFLDPCEAIAPRGTLVEQSFQVGEPVPLPDALGRVGPVEIRREPGSTTLCGRRTTVVRAGVEIELGAEARAYLPLMQLERFVDGALDGTVGWGQGAADAGSTLALELSGLCELAQGRASSRLAPLGAHELELRARIAGSPTAFPPVRASVTLDCPGIDPCLPEPSPKKGKESGCRTAGTSSSFAVEGWLALLGILAAARVGRAGGTRRRAP